MPEFSPIDSPLILSLAQAKAWRPSVAFLPLTTLFTTQAPHYARLCRWDSASAAQLVSCPTSAHNPTRMEPVPHTISYPAIAALPWELPTVSPTLRSRASTRKLGAGRAVQTCNLSRTFVSVLVHLRCQLLFPTPSVARRSLELPNLDRVLLLPA